jgi:hypothetical protein
MAESTLARMCMPEAGSATEWLVHDLFGLHRRWPAEEVWFARRRWYPFAPALGGTP